MPRSISVDKRGRIRVREVDVSRLINDWLQWRNWQVERTDVIAAKTSRGFFRQGVKGQSDWICMRPQRAGLVELFKREDKRPGGVTSPEQVIWKIEQELNGYLVCSIPPEETDGFKWFLGWYDQHFRD